MDNPILEFNLPDESLIYLQELECNKVKFDKFIKSRADDYLKNKFADNYKNIPIEFKYDIVNDDTMTISCDDKILCTANWDLLGCYTRMTPINNKDNIVNDDPINNKDNIVNDDPINNKDNIVNDDPINNKDNIVNDDPINNKDNIVNDDPINNKDNIVNDDPINNKDNIVNDDPINNKDNIVNDDPINNKDNIVNDDPINNKDNIEEPLIIPKPDEDMLYTWIWSWVFLPEERNNNIKKILTELPETAKLLAEDMFNVNDPMIISYIMGYLSYHMNLEYIYD